MDFILVRQFRNSEVTKPKTLKSSKKNEIVSFLFILKFKTMFSANCFSYKEQFLFVGLTNGKIFLYKKKVMDSKLIVERGKDHECIELTSTTAH